MGELGVPKDPLVREHPRLPLTRELSPGATEGEKMFRSRLKYMQSRNFQVAFSPPVSFADSPLVRGGHLLAHLSQRDRQGERRIILVVLTTNVRKLWPYL